MTCKSTELDHVKTIHKVYWIQHIGIFPLQDFTKIVAKDEYTSCERTYHI